jgi:hypothetical protein
MGGGGGWRLQGRGPTRLARVHLKVKGQASGRIHCFPHMRQSSCSIGLEWTDISVLVTKTTSLTKHNFFEQYNNPTHFVYLYHVYKQCKFFPLQVKESQMCVYSLDC